MTDILIRWGEFEHRDIWREDGQVKTETEIGIMLPQGKKHLGLPEAGRDKERYFSRALEGASPCQYHDFRLLAYWALGNCPELYRIATVLSNPVCGTCFWLLQKTNLSNVKNYQAYKEVEKKMHKSKASQ